MVFSLPWTCLVKTSLQGSSRLLGEQLAMTGEESRLLGSEPLHTLGRIDRPAIEDVGNQARV
jgi:hypothetical protein